LQELVYKQGQAGVTKASVSIVFNNSDRARSPVGYEHCEQITVTRQIIIGGRNKYVINGQTAQPQRVQNLFHSVQLNVNNPHFLIMQGRITKVLNMKPLEILGMLEEAAGTRMYENKKESALKTLEKKQTKVDEIDKLLEEEILPTIEKLRKERGEYMKWAAGNDALERLRRFCVAYEFQKIERQMEEEGRGAEALLASVSELDARETQRRSAEAAVEAERAQLEREQNAVANGETARLVEAVDALSKALVKERAALKHKEKETLGEKKIEEALRADLSKHDRVAETEAARLKLLEDSHVARRSALAEAETALEKAEVTLRGVQSGTGAGGDGAKSLQTQLAETSNAVAEAEVRSKNAVMKKKHCEKELRARREKFVVLEQKDATVLENVKIAEETYAAAKRAFENHPGSRTRVDAFVLESEAETAESNLRDAREAVDALHGQLAGLDFKFTDPESNFDRSKVKGVIAKLMRVSDPAAAAALEVVAGGKLYQVVVDTEVTGKALLAKGKLQRRVTIVPMNKIDGRRCSSSQSAAAAAISPDARLAVSFVTYDPHLENVMSYVFGKAFVCKDPETARAVAFDKNVLANCVTLEGDLLNPSGLLTGGSRGSGGSLLAKVHALHEAESVLATRSAEYASAQKRCAEATAAAETRSKLEAAADQAEHALGLARARVAGSERSQVAEQIAALESTMRASEDEIAEAAMATTTLRARVAEIRNEIANFAEERESRLEKAKTSVAEAKERLGNARAAIKNAETEMRDAAVERESTAAERTALADAVDEAKETVAASLKELEALQKVAGSLQERLETAQKALDARRAEASAIANALGALSKKRAALANAADGDSVTRKELRHKIARVEKETMETKLRSDQLLRDHPWIESESRAFGVPGSAYDFEKMDVEKAQAELRAREDAQACLSKRVNKKVIAMFDKAESEFKALREKRRIVLNDRSKIEAVIDELDEKKKEALKVTWEKVNADFGSIFSTLLPSTTAKLEPPEGESFLSGLEVKVAFGGVWKESLTELSGGQRSLLALSLILALLLFKPAPIYILDEVDAALDLSHTQNIGRMIRAHFPYSQFIVVSLKEGMFNNANCIFRTKFVDGVSTVTRTVPALKTANHNDADDLKGAAGVSDGAAAKQRRRKADADAKEN